MHPPHIYIIAGEASGDILGAGLMQALRQELGENITFSGVGGDRMCEAGLASLFPMQEISLMGLVEILPHIFRLKTLMRNTVDDIIHKQPDILITIDSPGFNFRIARRIREELGSKIPLVHYVAPTVWAYKPERAEKTAKLFDHLLVLLPFEPPYFEKHGLKTHFTGHPVVQLWKDKADGTAWRKQNAISENTPLLLTLPGSRRTEVLRHLPLLQQTVEQLKMSVPGLHVLFAIPPHLSDMVKEHAAKWNIPFTIASKQEEKKSAFAAADVALSKSGTVTLEVSATGIPMVIFYMVHPITAWLVRRWITISHANLLNLLAGKSIIPEFIQEKCTPQALANAVLPLFNDTAQRSQQLHAAQKALAQLSVPGEPDSNKNAAKTITSILRTRA